MKVGAVTRFILVHRQASSLYSLIADGQHRATSLGRDQWKSLIAGSSLQRNCNEEGFNSEPPSSGYDRIRIGIIGNEQNDCSSPDSFVGYGSSMSSCSCGNCVRCCYQPDNGNRHTPALGYILIQWLFCGRSFMSLTQTELGGKHISFFFSSTLRHVHMF